MTSWKDAVLLTLGNVLGTDVSLNSVSAVGGGDINEAFHFNTNEGSFFVKKNSASRFPGMFEKEAQGLKLLADADEIDTPEVVSFDTFEDTSFLILKYIQSASQTASFWQAFGAGLAQLHRHTSQLFGLDHDNYIGSLPQWNTTHDHWTSFFREQRLEIQVRMARDNSSISRDTVTSFERFYKKLDEIFPEEPPALIHGDLWSGNFMVNKTGEAVIIDPAVYYGHREMDLGMSRLFGGFAPQFYDAYQGSYPLEPGWQQRLDYCNLYPLMVHVNLFGGGYEQSVKSILRVF